MRLSTVLALLLGCGDIAKAPEITNNPQPNITVTADESGKVETQTTPVPNLTAHMSCVVPAAKVENGVAIYDLDPILDASGCEEGTANYVLRFVPGTTSVSFSCNSEAFTWWDCELPLFPEAQTHHFTFGRMDGSETEYELLTDPLIASQCAGQEASIVFWSTRTGANTLCNTKEDISRGFQDVHFPAGNARIVLKGML